MLKQGGWVLKEGCGVPKEGCGLLKEPNGAVLPAGNCTAMELRYPAKHRVGAGPADKTEASVGESGGCVRRRIILSIKAAHDTTREAPLFDN